MQPQIVGISGNRIKNGNTYRRIQAFLEGSGLSTEFILPWEQAKILGQEIARKLEKQMRM